MVAFEPCLATIGGWRWVRKHHHIYTIPYLYLYRVADLLSQISGASASTDDLNKAIRESLYCFGVLANAASAS